MVNFLPAITILTFTRVSVSSFVVPHAASHKSRHEHIAVPPLSAFSVNVPFHFRITNSKISALDDSSSPSAISKGEKCTSHTWSPQDLTKDNHNFVSIPTDDYVKKYQQNPELWPVEFFLITHRQMHNTKTGKIETQLLVRRSANGTSKYGLGTGVPATRWVLSTQDEKQQQPPPRGYNWSEPRIRFEANNFPEFPKDDNVDSWMYDKIDIREDAFYNLEFRDVELEEYAEKVHNELKLHLSQILTSDNSKKEQLTSWEYSVASAVAKIVNNANCVAAIQGTLRMSGLFQHRETTTTTDDDDATTSSRPRFVSFDERAVKPSKLAQSMRIYTMFPQMPDPMPLPFTTPEELQKEIATRASVMAKSGRDPHKDKYGRVYTHISTSNVSNTIHGIYLTLDATDIPNLDEVYGRDLFGTERIEREWVSLEELKVLDTDGENIGTDDTKPTFISGFIVRQLVKEGVISKFKNRIQSI